LLADWYQTLSIAYRIRILFGPVLLLTPVIIPEPRIRLRLSLVYEVPLGIDDHSWRRTERTMIEIVEALFELEAEASEWSRLFFTSHTPLYLTHSNI
jgi:hypothetical protein